MPAVKPKPLPDESTFVAVMIYNQNPKTETHEYLVDLTDWISFGMPLPTDFEDLVREQRASFLADRIGVSQGREITWGTWYTFTFADQDLMTPREEAFYLAGMIQELAEGSYGIICRHHKFMIDSVDYNLILGPTVQLGAAAVSRRNSQDCEWSRLQDKSDSLIEELNEQRREKGLRTFLTMQHVQESHRSASGLRSLVEELALNPDLERHAGSVERLFPRQPAKTSPGSEVKAPGAKNHEYCLRLKRLDSVSQPRSSLVEWDPDLGRALIKRPGLAQPQWFWIPEIVDDAILLQKKRRQEAEVKKAKDAADEAAKRKREIDLRIVAASPSCAIGQPVPNFKLPASAKAAVPNAPPTTNDWERRTRSPINPNFRRDPIPPLATDANTPAKPKAYDLALTGQEHENQRAKPLAQSIGTPPLSPALPRTPTSPPTIREHINPQLSSIRRPPSPKEGLEAHVGAAEPAISRSPREATARGEAENRPPTQHDRQLMPPIWGNPMAKRPQHKQDTFHDTSANLPTQSAEPSGTTIPGTSAAPPSPTPPGLNTNTPEKPGSHSPALAPRSVPSPMSKPAQNPERTFVHALLHTIGRLTFPLESIEELRTLMTERGYRVGSYNAAQNRLEIMAPNGEAIVLNAAELMVSVQRGIQRSQLYGAYRVEVDDLDIDELGQTGVAGWPKATDWQTVLTAGEFWQDCVDLCRDPDLWQTWGEALAETRGCANLEMRLQAIRRHLDSKAVNSWYQFLILQAHCKTDLRGAQYLLTHLYGDCPHVGQSLAQYRDRAVSANPDLVLKPWLIRNVADEIEQGGQTLENPRGLG